MADLETGLITTALGGVFGAISGALTSYVVSKNSSKRTELINRVAKIEANLEQLSDIAVEYWASDWNELEAQKLERSIKRLRKKCGLELTRLKKKNSISRTCDTTFSSFIRVVMGTDHTRETYFEKKLHSSDRERIEEIHNLQGDLVTELRKSLNIT